MTDTIHYHELAEAGSATVYEANGRRGDLDPAIRRISSTRAIAGPAFCVSCARGDNLAIHRAVAEASAGDILVVAGHQAAYGYLGDILAEAAKLRGIAGIVVDGHVRDHLELQKLDFPVWARGLAIRGADKAAPGEIGIAIDCGGVRVAQGDLVVADDDGVAIVSSYVSANAIEATRRRIKAEITIRAGLRDGAVTLDLFELRKYIRV